MFYEASPSFRDRYYAAMASSYGDVAIQEKGDLAEQRVGLVDVHRQPRRAILHIPTRHLLLIGGMQIAYRMGRGPCPAYPGRYRIVVQQVPYRNSGCLVQRTSFSKDKLRMASSMWIASLFFPDGVAHHPAAGAPPLRRRPHFATSRSWYSIGLLKEPHPTAG